MNQQNPELSADFLQLARIAMTGRQQDVQLLIHRASKKYKSLFPELTTSLIALLQESPTRTTPLRKQADIPLPVDLDSRLQLLRIEKGQLEFEPIFSENLENKLNQVISERKQNNALLKHGLHPTKSVLFNGPPGVGKTMAAKWIAEKLGKPLLILDLAAVMSTYLGRTGNNIRFVLDYAKNTDCVLLLDELDSIAKRRDDDSEIGELKRLVTVLLQEIDDWPHSGLLIAATNHPDLLDPAIWRRFELVLNFSKPNDIEIEQQLLQLLNNNVEDKAFWSKILSLVFSGKSFSDVEREINLLRRAAAIEDIPLEKKIMAILTSDMQLSKDQRVELACILYDKGIVTQRGAQEITGVARETIRKHAKKTKP